MTLCVIGRVKFERDCGKMYSRHLFPYGGLGQQSLHGERWMGQVTTFTKNVYVMLRVDLYNENVVSVNVTYNLGQKVLRILHFVIHGGHTQ